MCGVLAILFLVVPAVEIYLIIEIGALLGTGLTLAIIALTAVVGAGLVKQQGIAVMHKLRASVGQGEGTSTALVEGVLVLVAGVTLLAPGFMTDCIGLCLLIPSFRGALAVKLLGKFQVVTVGVGAGFGGTKQEDRDNPPPPGVIDV